LEKNRIQRFEKCGGIFQNTIKIRRQWGEKSTERKKCLGKVNRKKKRLDWASGGRGTPEKQSAAKRKESCVLRKVKKIANMLTKSRKKRPKGEEIKSTSQGDKQKHTINRGFYKLE